MKKRRLILPIALTAAALGLASCGVKKSTNPDDIGGGTGEKPQDPATSTYQVTFNTNGGSSVDAKNVESGKTISRPADPTRLGFAFSGWYSNSTLTTPFDFNSKISANTTLYAKWEANKYTVTFSTNGGSSVADQSIEYGSSIDSVSTTKAGYTFAGWYTDSALTNSFDISTAITGNTALYAKWIQNAPDTNTISFVTDGGSSVEAITVTNGEAFTLPTPTKAGHTFAGWYNGSTKVESGVWSGNSNLTLTAHWTVNSYKVLFMPNGGSGVMFQTVDYGNTISEVSTTKAGYTFAGWYTDSALTNSFDISTPITADTFLYAKWETAVYTVTFVTNGGSSIAPQTISHGGEISIVSTSREGYTFAGWYTDSALTTAYVEGAITKNLTLYAKWNEIKSDDDFAVEVNETMTAYIDGLISKTQNSSTPYKPAWNAEGFKDRWNYIDGVFLTSIVDLYKQTGDEKYKNFLVTYVNYYIDSNGNFLKASTGSKQSLNQELDTICESKILYDLYGMTGDERYVKAIETSYNLLMNEGRATNGVNFEHKPSYPKQVWLDGMYMYVPFYARYALYKNDESIFNEIKTQYEWIRNNMFDETAKLYYHGNDTSTSKIFWADSTTGNSKSFWLRSMGWYIASLVDVLDYYPEGANKNYLKGLLQEAMDGLMLYQDEETDMFYQVIDKGPVTVDVPVNYLTKLGNKAYNTSGVSTVKISNYLESSGSSIIAYVAMKGARQGYLSADYLQKGISVFEGVYKHSLDTTGETPKLGDICVSAGLGDASKTWRDGTIYYYLAEPVGYDDAKGTGPFIMAYLQYKAQKAALKNVTYNDDYLLYPNIKVDNNAIIIPPMVYSREGYEFGGWYTDSSFTNLYSFGEPVAANTNLYAKWISSSAGSVTVTLETNGGNAISPIVLNKGEKLSLSADPVKSGYVFAHWWTDAAHTKLFDFNTPITADITLYASWEEAPAASIITNYAAYDEGMFMTFEEPSITATTNVQYKCVSSGDADWTNVDSELIRRTDTTGVARVDAVGLQAGVYSVKVTNSSGVTNTIENIVVSEQDRSGYAHFNNTTGVGAYNNDGTLKSNAVVVYVTNDTKNSVSYGGYTGLTSILQNQSKFNKPLCVRVLDSIKTNQWNYKSAEPRKTDNSNLQTDTFWSNTFSTKYGKNLAGLTVKYMDKYREKGVTYTTTADGLGSSKEGSSSSKTTKYKATEYRDSTGKLIAGVQYKSFSGVEVYDDDSYWNMLDISNASNVTVEGIGADAEIFQWGIEWANCNSIEVKNLTFTDYPEDASSFEGSNVNNYSGYWFHNNTVNIGYNAWDVSGERDKYDGDGGVDLKKANGITLSYNQFNDCHKTGLVGGGDSDLTKNVTFHHNFYNQCRSRLPLGRQANMHMYNNYYYKSGDYSSSLRANAYAFIENCYYDGGNNPYQLYDSTAKVKAYNNIFDSVSTSGSSYYKTNNVSTRDEAMSSSCKPDGSTSYENFDTDSSLFYYDSVNKKTNVANMLQASEVKTYIPKHAGAGKLVKTIDNSTVTYYTVTVNANGGTASQSSISVKEGSSISLPTATKSGYTLEGWYKDAALTQKVTSSTMVTSNMTIYAKWVDASSTFETMTLSLPSAASYTSDVSAGVGFTIKASDSKIVNITSSRIELGGTGSTDYRCIVANVGTSEDLQLTIKCKSSGSSDRELVVVNSRGEQVATIAAPASEATNTATISGDDTYYIYSSNSGVHIYSVSISK